MPADASAVLLLGDPVSRSLSPAMQNAGFEALQIDCRYEVRQVGRDALAAAIEDIRADARILGANVTIPDKEAVIPLLDELDPLAGRIGAVNTISRQGGTLKGWNTDVEGFQRALAEVTNNSLPRSPGPSAHASGAAVPGERLRRSGRVRVGAPGGYPRVAIIGAGGAARAVAAALRPAAEVWVVARNLDQANRLCRDLEIQRGGPVGIAQMRATVEGADLIVNATPADLPPVSWLRPDQRLFDLRSRRSTEGRAMLLHQGAASFEIWTGRAAPLAVMRAALERAAEGVPA
jgi:shikimate dehydrogenase